MKECTNDYFEEDIPEDYLTDVMASVSPVKAMDVDKIKERSKKKADLSHTSDTRSAR